MSYRVICLIFCLTTAFAVAQEVATPVHLTDQQLIHQAVAALGENDSDGVRALASKIQEAAPRLFLLAQADRLSGKPEAAIQKVAQVVAFHYQNIDWLPRSELLCAELYMELGKTNAAQAVVRQILQLYAGTDVAKEADVLRLEIEKKQITDIE